jgi:hypothetical protein
MSGYARADRWSSFGCVLKDPSIGLIDFLSLRKGREVYLCWHLGEMVSTSGTISMQVLLDASHSKL